MSDPYNSSPDPQEKHLQYVDFKEEKEAKNIGTIFIEFQDWIKSRGFIFIPNPVGKYCYNDIYCLKSPTSVDIDYPPNFKVLKKLQTEADLITFNNLVLEYLEEYSSNSHEYKLLFPLTSGGNKSKLSSWMVLKIQAQKASRANNPAPEEFRISPKPLLTKDPSIHSLLEYAPISYLPLEEWFPESVKQVTIDDVLTLFPKVERHLLSLIIGRGVVGKSNHIPPGYDEPIKHTSRMMAIVLGDDPGLGKSALFDFILNACRSVGYVVNTFSSIDKQFNLGEVVSSDLVYKDDITDKSLKAFLSSENAKPVISSSGLLRVEDKGEQAFNVEPRSTVIINCNNFSPYLKYDLDPGMKDRVHIISTKREVELEKMKMTGVSEGSSSFKPEFHIPYLADKVGVEVNTLMLWFLRLCADKFLESITVKQQGINPLELTVGEFSLGLRRQLNINELSCVLMLFGLSTRLNLFGYDRDRGWKSYRKVSLQDVPFYAALITTYNLYCYDIYQPFLWKLKEHYDNSDLRVKEIHPFRGYKIIDPLSIRGALHNYDLHQKDSLIAMAEAMHSIRNKEGMNFTNKIVHWVNGWEKIKHSFSSISMELYKLWLGSSDEGIRNTLLKQEINYEVRHYYKTLNPNLKELKASVSITTEQEEDIYND